MSDKNSRGSEFCAWAFQQYLPQSYGWYKNSDVKHSIGTATTEVEHDYKSEIRLMKYIPYLA